MISKGKVVSLAYLLTNDKGEELDRAEKGTPFHYLHGARQIIRGLESAIETMKIGDKKKVTVSPTEGYGELDPKLKMSLDRSNFPKDVELEEGMQFEANLSDDDDDGRVFTIESVQGDKVNVNGNHPLAGMTLHFDVEVLGVREATKEELTHNHAHGPNGHGHDHDGHGHDH